MDLKNNTPTENRLIFASITLLIFEFISLNKAYKEFNFITALDLNDLTINQIQIWLFAVLIPVISSILIWNNKNLGWFIGAFYLIYNLIIDSTLISYEFANLGRLSGINGHVKFVTLIIKGVALYCLYSKDVIQKLKGAQNI